jgi:hypothetical protein
MRQNVKRSEISLHPTITEEEEEEEDDGLNKVLFVGVLTLCNLDKFTTLILVLLAIVMVTVQTEV